MERINPFVSTLVVPYIRVVVADADIHALEESDFFEVESDKYTRLYHNKHIVHNIFKLNAPALQLLMWIMIYISEDAQSIKLDEVELCKVFDCSCKTVHRMKSTLIASAFIAKRDTNKYWINPNYFASGNRLKIYPGNKLLINTIQKKW